MSWGVMELESWRKGPWTCEEDKLLIAYVNLHGDGRWNSVARLAGLKRNGKSCRLRWVNYLRPDLKRGHITSHEHAIILHLHARWGNKWASIARSLPGRTDNEIKNYWRTHFKKKAKAGSDNLEKQFQQQQVKEVSNELDMERLMSLMEENNNQNMVQGVSTSTTVQSVTASSGDQEEELSYFNSMINSTNVTMNEDMIMWDGFWNFDDVYATNCSAPTTTDLYNLVR